MREARNPQGSTPSFRGAPVVRFETCAHGARMWQPKNLTAWSIFQFQHDIPHIDHLVARDIECPQGQFPASFGQL